MEGWVTRPHGAGRRAAADAARPRRLGRHLVPLDRRPRLRPDDRPRRQRGLPAALPDAAARPAHARAVRRPGLARRRALDRPHGGRHVPALQAHGRALRPHDRAPHRALPLDLAARVRVLRRLRREPLPRARRRARSCSPSAGASSGPRSSARSACSRARSAWRSCRRSSGWPGASARAAGGASLPIALLPAAEVLFTVYLWWETGDLARADARPGARLGPQPGTAAGRDLERLHRAGARPPRAALPRPHLLRDRLDGHAGRALEAPRRGADPVPHLRRRLRADAVRGRQPRLGRAHRHARLPALLGARDPGAAARASTRRSRSSRRRSWPG